MDQTPVSKYESKSTVGFLSVPLLRFFSVNMNKCSLQKSNIKIKYEIKIHQSAKNKIVQKGVQSLKSIPLSTVIQMFSYFSS